jgi:two-component system, chemotaxis family, response regulator Rcp1
LATLLLVEDSPGAVRLTRDAFHEANPLIEICVVADGVEAMQFLRNEGAFADAPRPDLILLDLNLPRMDGREVLVQLKADEDLKVIPTVILTSSNDDLDVVRSYELRANCYLNKPTGLDAFEGLVRSINDFWTTHVRLPQPQRRTQ